MLSATTGSVASITGRDRSESTCPPCLASRLAPRWRGHVPLRAATRSGGIETCRFRPGVFLRSAPDHGQPGLLSWLPDPMRAATNRDREDVAGDYRSPPRACGGRVADRRLAGGQGRV